MELIKRVIKQRPDSFEQCITQTNEKQFFQVRFEEADQRDLFFWGVWQFNIEHLMKQILEDGDTFIDVGANIGYFSILGAKLVGTNGKVLSFEPVSSNRKTLHYNVSLNGYSNISIYEYALSDCQGTVDFYQPNVSCTLGSFRFKAGQDFGSNSTKTSVQTALLDDLVKKEMVKHVKLIKMDVEGAELKALKGMEQLLSSKKSPDVICEVCDEYLREMGTGEDELMAFMYKLGYRAFVLNENRNISKVMAEKGKKMREYSKRNNNEKKHYVNIYFTQ